MDDRREELRRNCVRNSLSDRYNYFKIPSRSRFDSGIWNFFDPPIRVKKFSKTTDPTFFDDEQDEDLYEKTERFRGMLRSNLSANSMGEFYKPSIKKQNRWINEKHWIPIKSNSIDWWGNNILEKTNLFDKTFSPSMFVHKVDQSSVKDLYDNFNKIPNLRRNMASRFAQKCEDIRTQMIENKKRSLKELEDIIDLQIRTFEESILQKYKERMTILENVDRNEMEKKFRELDVQLKSPPTPLTKIILECSDAFLHIFSFMSTKEILQRILPISTYFYSYVRKNVPLELVIPFPHMLDFVPLSVLSQFRISKFEFGTASGLNFYARKKITSILPFHQFLKSPQTAEHLREIRLFELECSFMQRSKNIQSSRNNRSDKEVIHGVFDMVSEYCPRLERLETSVLPTTMHKLLYLKKIVFPINYFSLSKKSEKKENNGSSSSSRGVGVLHFRTQKDVMTLIGYLEEQQRGFLEEIFFVDTKEMVMLDYMRNANRNNEYQNLSPEHMRMLKRLNESIRKSCPNLRLYHSRMFFGFTTMSSAFLTFLACTGGKVRDVQLVYNGEYFRPEMMSDFYYIGGEDGDNEFQRNFDFGDSDWRNVDEQGGKEEVISSVCEVEEEEEEEDSKNFTDIYPQIDIIKSTPSHPKNKQQEGEEEDEEVEGENEEEDDDDDNNNEKLSKIIGTITPPQNIINMRKSYLETTTSSPATPVRNLENELTPSPPPLPPFPPLITESNMINMKFKEEKYFPKIQFLSRCLEKRKTESNKKSDEDLIFRIYDVSRKRKTQQGSWGGVRNLMEEVIRNIDDDKPKTLSQKFIDDIIFNIPYISYRVQMGLNYVEGWSEEEEEDKNTTTTTTTERKRKISSTLVYYLEERLKNMIVCDGLELEIGFSYLFVEDGDDGERVRNLYERRRPPQEEEESKSLRNSFNDDLIFSLKERIIRRPDLKKLKFILQYEDRGSTSKNEGYYGNSGQVYGMMGSGYGGNKNNNNEEEKASKNTEKEELVRYLEKEFCFLPNLVMRLMEEEREVTSIETLGFEIMFWRNCFVQFRDLRTLIYDTIIPFLKGFGSKRHRQQQDKKKKLRFDAKIEIAGMVVGEKVVNVGGQGQGEDVLLVREDDRDGTRIKSVLEEVNRDIREVLFNGCESHDWYEVNFELMIYNFDSYSTNEYQEVRVVYKREKKR